MNGGYYKALSAIIATPVNSRIWWKRMSLKISTIKYWIRRNTIHFILTVVLFFCFVPLGLYWIYRNSIEWFSGADLLFSMTCNILYGYIASYIFYFLNVYLPEREQKKKCYNAVGSYLAKVRLNLKSLQQSYSFPIAERDLGGIFTLSDKQSQECIYFSEYNENGLQRDIVPAMDASLFVLHANYMLLRNAIRQACCFEPEELNSLEMIVDNISPHYKENISVLFHSLDKYDHVIPFDLIDFQDAMNDLQEKQKLPHEVFKVIDSQMSLLSIRLEKHKKFFED
ncbi:hypothetical protein [Halodesulfovibrio aestuarii]|uniref:hypothetical protein n=1 Tax=Halodesulfovibrio aestuarii TaxID=126333 RepID=UPI0004842E4A